MAITPFDIQSTTTPQGATVTTQPYGQPNLPNLAAVNGQGALGNLGGALGNIMNWKMQQQAKKDAMARRQAELDLQMKQAQLKAFQESQLKQPTRGPDKTEKYVPIFSELQDAGMGRVPGYGVPTTTMGGMNSVARGWVPESQAGNYKRPDLAQAQPSAPTSSAGEDVDDSNRNSLVLKQAQQAWLTPGYNEDNERKKKQREAYGYF